MTQAASPEDTKVKVFGVGLSKTGTSSLAAALEELGLPTVHNDRAFVPFLHPAARQRFAEQLSQP